MDSNSLIGKSLKRVWVFQEAPVHPAWVGEFTTPINTWIAFLEFSDGELVSLSPCEVNLSDDRYPSLGLAIRATTRASMTVRHPGGRVIDAVQLEEVTGILPAVITSVEASDPLAEDTTTQYAIGGSGWRIIFRHIFPPMTLGICVERR